MNNDNSRSWILKYIDLIDKGEIIVGEELYLQLEKLKKELTDPIYQNIMNIKILNLLKMSVSILKHHMQVSHLY